MVQCPVKVVFGHAFSTYLPIPVAKAQPSPATFSVACSVRIRFAAQIFERNLTLKRRPRVTCTNKSWVAHGSTRRRSQSLRRRNGCPVAEAQHSPGSLPQSIRSQAGCGSVGNLRQGSADPTPAAFSVT